MALKYNYSEVVNNSLIFNTLLLTTEDMRLYVIYTTEDNVDVYKIRIFTTLNDIDQNLLFCHTYKATAVGTIFFSVDHTLQLYINRDEHYLIIYLETYEDLYNSSSS